MINKVIFLFLGLPSGELFEIVVYASTVGAGRGPPSTAVIQHTRPPGNNISDCEFLNVTTSKISLYKSS